MPLDDMTINEMLTHHRAATRRDNPGRDQDQRDREDDDLELRREPGTPEDQENQ